MLELHLEGYFLAHLGPADGAILQDLYVRCSDYHELEEGIPTRPGAAEHLLTALPPNKVLRDKFVIGLQTSEGRLIGVLDVIHNYLGEREWWLGLLMLEPEMRASGLGGQLYRAVARAVEGRGGTSIYLGVLEQNASAERFWRRQGFEELRREPYTAASGHQSRVIVMRHSLA